MATLSLVLSVVLVILSVLLCVIILLQSKRSAGLGAIGGGSGDTYWSKNKGSSMEGALERYTKIGGALFMILALVINLIG
ncbi:preprotein translocase subunit SecG [Anaerotignum lactatifermentans]